MAASLGVGDGVGYVAGGIDAMAETLDRSGAIYDGLAKSGYDSLPEQMLWRLQRDDNSEEGKRDRDGMAWIGGYRSPTDRMAIKAYDQYAKSHEE